MLVGHLATRSEAGPIEPARALRIHGHHVQLESQLHGDGARALQYGVAHVLVRLVLGSNLRRGEHGTAAPRRMAQGLTDTQVDDLAAWFAAL